MKKSLVSLLALSIIPHQEYSGPMIDDQKVLDCIMNMYFYLLSEENDPRKEEFFDKFSKQYDALDPREHEQVREDYLSIVKAQEEHQEKELQKEKPQ
jgi:hypothetical protein